MKELTLDEIQQESFKILLVIKKICEENNFKYFLQYGTLLGAIRHNGFIPWDDDIDLMMPRDDYEKFIEYFYNNREKYAPLEIFNFRYNKDYIYPITRISNSEFKADYDNTKDYGLGTFVDIYPYDGYKKSHFIQNFKINYNHHFIYQMGLYEMVPVEGFVKTILKKSMFKKSRKADINKIIAKQEKLAKKLDYKKCEYVANQNWDPEPFKREYIDELIMHEFNGIEFPIPKKYDELLKFLYGDYMKLPPENERIGHHYYKIYKK